MVICFCQVFASASVSGTSGEKKVKADDDHHQPGDLVAHPKCKRKEQRQQRQNAQRRDESGRVADPRRNQQTAKKARHQSGAEQHTDGFRRQAKSGKPDAPERQEDAVAKKR
jgi:hypothetical protein